MNKDLDKKELVSLTETVNETLFIWLIMDKLVS